MTREDLVLREATQGDYSAFVRLFPELAVTDPTPSREAWQTNYVPSTTVACLGAVVVGYCYFQEYEDTGYIRHVVVAPDARRRGVGQSLMQAVGERLRAAGKKTWRLNVKVDNVAAIALYERFGLRVQYATRALVFPWSAIECLPTSSATVTKLRPERDAEVEEHFSLPRGQLEGARRRELMLLEVASNECERPIGLAVFDPAFPGAFPFRLSEPGAARALLSKMCEYREQKDCVNLVIEDNLPLSALLERAGATLKFEILHMAGEL